MVRGLEFVPLDRGQKEISLGRSRTRVTHTVWNLPLAVAKNVLNEAFHMSKTKIEVSRPTKLTTANILSYLTSLNLFMSFSGINFHTGQQKRGIVHSMRLDLFFHPEIRKSTARVPFRGEK